MLQRSRWSALAALCCWLVAGAGVAQAANINFNGSNTVPVCPLSGTTYTCATLPLGSNDTAVISSGYTVVVNSGVSLAYGQGLSMSGTAALQVKGNLDLSASNGLNVTGGSLSTTGNFKLGASAQSITANVSAATVTTGGASTYIGGTVTASGDINLGSSTTITGAVSTTGTGSLTTGSSSTLGPLSVKGSINLSSSNTINGSVTATSITTNSSVTINGSITLAQTSGGVADLGSGIKVNGTISAYSVQTTSPVTLNGDVSAVSSLTLASGSSVTGNIVSPVVTLNASNSTVKGNITASTSLDMGSGVAVTGTVNTGGLTMRASNSVINGNATVTGDVDMGSGTTINGDLSARNVNTRASNAVINGNAAVNAIYIDWGNSVTKTITCTGPGAAQCSCVTKADPNYKPTCGAAAPSGADHIQITHNGQGLTCQPSPVTLRACADANCTSTYNGTTTVTLTPGGGQVTFNGSANASVYDQKAETIALSTSATTTCINSANSSASNQCNMTFATSGLTLSVPDHLSMSPNILMQIQALKAGPNNSSCVPLATGGVPVKFSCSYKNPATGSAALKLGSPGTTVACGSGATDVGVTLDSNGTGTLSLQYPDVGLMSVSANYSTSSVNAGGSASFTAAPASFKIAGTPPSAIGINSKTAFARASDPFTLDVSAVNANGDITPNFGKENPAQSFTLGPVVLKYPSDGETITTAMLTQGTFGSISGGKASSATWVFRETGVITLNALLSSSSQYYMNNTTTGFKTVGTVDLRFTPHHFDTVLLSGPQMKCSNVGGYSNPCAKPYDQGSLLYSKQVFGLQLNAYKDDTNLSKNYRLRTNGTADAEDVARPITWSTLNAADGTGNTDATLTLPSVLFSAGVALLNASDKPVLTFNRDQTPPNMNAPATILLRATDSDGATSARSGSAEAVVTLVSGSMTLSNAYGPINTDLPVEARAMYYSDAAKAWLFNPAFPNTPPGASAALTKASASFASCGQICAKLQVRDPSTLSFKSGKGMITVLAPKAAGIATIQLDKTLFPYLPMYDVGHLTFGTSRPSPVIYTREVYN
jgi:MSHA biogenesis protein MshQ